MMAFRPGGTVHLAALLFALTVSGCVAGDRGGDTPRPDNTIRSGFGS